MHMRKKGLLNKISKDHRREVKSSERIVYDDVKRRLVARVKVSGSQRSFNLMSSSCS